MKKLNKLKLHCSSVMNTCQAIVNPDGPKRETNKSKGMRDAMTYVLCHKHELEQELSHDSIARLNCVCGTVSSILSGLKTRSLGLNTLGTT